MNRDQYLQKKGWRAQFAARPDQLAAQARQGDPSPPARPVGSPPVALAAGDSGVPMQGRIAVASAHRNSLPPPSK